jgi:hypothetical protein
MPTIKIHNAETNEVTEREMTADELTQWDTDQANAQARAEAEAQQAAVKASAQAKLAALGLTQEEIAALSK